MIVNILNHSNTQKKKFPNFCQITPTSYLKVNRQHTLITTADVHIAHITYCKTLFYTQKQHNHRVNTLPVPVKPFYAFPPTHI